MTYPYHVYLQRLAKVFMIIERFHIMSPSNHKLEFMLLGLNVVNQHNVMMSQTLARAKAHCDKIVLGFGDPNPKRKCTLVVVYVLQTFHFTLNTWPHSACGV